MCRDLYIVERKKERRHCRDSYLRATIEQDEGLLLEWSTMIVKVAFYF